MRIVYIIMIISAIIDRTSKLLSIFLLKTVDSVSIIPGFFNLSYVNNYGASFGMLKGRTFLLIFISVICFIAIYKYIVRNKLSIIENVSYGLILGGIIGNLIDRVVYGYVIDFLDFKIFGYNFPVFNVADSCLVVGVLILLILMIRGEIYDKSK